MPEVCSTACSTGEDPKSFHRPGKTQLPYSFAVLGTTHHLHSTYFFFGGGRGGLPYNYRIRKHGQINTYLYYMPWKFSVGLRVWGARVLADHHLIAQYSKPKRDTPKSTQGKYLQRTYPNVVPSKLRGPKRYRKPVNPKPAAEKEPPSYTSIMEVTTT